jgi:hypothetical protein
MAFFYWIPECEFITKNFTGKKINYFAASVVMNIEK